MPLYIDLIFKLTVNVAALTRVLNNQLSESSSKRTSEQAENNSSTDSSDENSHRAKQRRTKYRSSPEYSRNGDPKQELHKHIKVPSEKRVHHSKPKHKKHKPSTKSSEKRKHHPKHKHNHKHEAAKVSSDTDTHQKRVKQKMHKLSKESSDKSRKLHRSHSGKRTEKYHHVVPRVHLMRKSSERTSVAARAHASWTPFIAPPGTCVSGTRVNGTSVWTATG